MDSIPAPSCIKLSQDLLYAVKTGNTHHPYLQQLKALPIHAWQQELVSDAHKKAFWINIYNAFVQIALSQNPALYQKRSRFFQRAFIDIGHRSFSLDNIEHGILRRSQFKWGLGYLTNPFASRLEKKLRVTTLDCRIHFALNCGAKSCPPIAFYSPQQIEAQLQMATANYLQQTVVYLPAQQQWILPAILSWFRGDFGGKKGIMRLLQAHQLIPPNAPNQANVSFKKYDWSLQLQSFANG